MKNSVLVIFFVVVALAFAGVGYLAGTRSNTTREAQKDEHASISDIVQAAEKAQAYLDAKDIDGVRLSSRYEISRINAGSKREGDEDQIYFTAILEDKNSNEEDSVLNGERQNFQKVLRIPAEGEPVLTAEEISRSPRVRRITEPNDNSLGDGRKRLRVRRVPVPPKN